MTGKTRFDLRRAGGIVTAALILGLAAAGCGGGGGGQGEQAQAENQNQNQNKSIKMAYVNWAEGIAMTNLVQAILEDRMGYQVQTTMADVAPVFTSVANGDADFFVDAWLPVTHASYMEQYGDKLEDLGINYAGARIGLVVPDYVTISSIPELNDHKSQFDGQIVGIDSGAGIMKTTDKAIQEYGLDLKLVPSSGPAMTAALKGAEDNNEWIVVTGWKPHWMFARWQLKFLEDPKGIYGKAENIHTVARLGFKEAYPKVAAFLEKFKLDDQQLGSLEDMINQEETGQPITAAREWMKQHEDLVNAWTGGSGDQAQGD